MRRAAGAALALALIVSACTTASDDVVTISSPAASSTTTTTTTVTTTTVPDPVVPEIPAPPADLIRADLVVPGYSSEWDFSGATLDQLVDLIEDVIVAGVVQILTDDTTGESVAALAAVPVPSLIGIPGLARQLAARTHGATEIEEVAVAGTATWRTRSGDAWIYWWHSNSRVFVVEAMGLDEEAGAARAEAAIAAIAAGHQAVAWQQGDCLLFDPPELASMPHAPFGTANIVDCAGPHTVEVSGATTLEATGDAPFPGSELNGAVRSFCDESFDEHIGGIARRSDLGQISYLPDEEEWAEGDRYLACIVFVQEPDGSPGVIARSLEGAGPRYVVDPVPGTCYDGGAQISCNAVHDTEFLGTAPAPFDEYPPFAEAVPASDAACEELAAEIVPDRGLTDAFLFVYTLPLSAYELERGTPLDCYAAVVDASGTQLPFRGSLLDGAWEVVLPGEGGLEA